MSVMYAAGAAALYREANYALAGLAPWRVWRTTNTVPVVTAAPATAARPIASHGTPESEVGAGVTPCSTCTCGSDTLDVCSGGPCSGLATAITRAAWHYGIGASIGELT
jgi:hypothetical protein